MGPEQIRPVLVAKSSHPQRNLVSATAVCVKQRDDDQNEGLEYECVHANDVLIERMNDERTSTELRECGQRDFFFTNADLRERSTTAREQRHASYRPAVSVKSKFKSRGY